MGVKGDFKATGSVTNGNVTVPGKKEKPEISVDTVPGRDYKDDVIEDLNNDLRKLQKSLTCVICLDMLFEPYSLQCGHVFCYTCMLDWLGQQRKRTCPECRDVVKIQPAPAYLIREMTETFVYRAELTSPHGSGAELRKQQREALKAVERDKASEGKQDKGGLFHGMFKKRKKPLRAMRDPEDGVLRCPECNWEVEDGFCDHCGRSVRTGFHHRGDFSDDEDEDDDDDSGSETESDREDDRGLPAWDDETEFDQDLDDEDEEDWGDESRHLQQLRYALQRHGDGGDDDDGDDDDDDRTRDSSVSAAGRRNEPINLDDDSDISLQMNYTNRSAMPPMRTRRRPPPGVISQAREQPRAGRVVVQESSEIEEESEDEDEGSLADFVEHDTPENRRRRPAPSRNGGGLRGPQNNSPMIISSSPVIAPPTRRNARRTVLDDEEENQSSVSEASPRPQTFRGEIRHDYTQRRGPIALPSDNDDDEVELLGSDMGYAPLDYTASENEDDGFMSTPARRGPQVNQASHPSGPGSVFSVPEEDEEDEESRAFGDDDESEDQDGDVRMGGNEQRNERRGQGPGSNGQRAVRSRARASRPRVVEDEDSDSDSDVAPATRRRRIQATGTRGSNYFRAHHRDSNGGNRQTNSGRRQREIDPAFLNMFQRHGQAMTERQLETLGVMNSSVSPARSATPVQRHYTGGSSRGSRSTRESTREPTRELTPVQAMGQSSPPPPFSPMFQGISSSPVIMAPSSPAPNSPASNNPQSPLQVQSPHFTTGVRAGGESNASSQSWNTHLPSPQAPRPVPITIGVSPQASRVRGRNSRQQLRGSSSRAGLRVGSVTPTPTSPQSAQPFQGRSAMAVIMGRQQSGRPTLAAAASRGGVGALTAEDIRARGEAVRRRQQEEAARDGGLRTRSSRRDLSASTGSSNASTTPAPLATVGRAGTGNLQATGRRFGAVIGGVPGQGAGGGPMLIIGSEDD